MISDSLYWKDELLKLSQKVGLRLTQRRWNQRSLFAVEKEVFIGFYSIRKLIESKKVSSSASGKNYKVREFPRNSKFDISLVDDPSKEFDFTKYKQIDISIADMCNQFIHSYYFLPVIPDGTALIGFFICSDYQRKKSIYFINVLDVIDIYKTVGKDFPISYHIRKNDSDRINVNVE